MEPISDDVISRGQRFKTIVLLLCEYTDKAMHSVSFFSIQQFQFFFKLTHGDLEM